MNAPYLVSGSLAFDTILSHKGHFHARILPESLARLNVAFGIDAARESFGGTGANIAHNAALLGDAHALFASAGALDFAPFREHLERSGADVSSITVHPDLPCARAYILTDSLNNQITGFHKGAMARLPRLPDESSAPLWHLAPDEIGTMLAMLERARALSRRQFLDPGQALPAFLELPREELSGALSGASGLFVNEYESLLLEEALGLRLSEIPFSDPEAFVCKTAGGDGSFLIRKGSSEHVPVAAPSAVVDPTGCGDAFRAGFLHIFSRGGDPLRACQLGSVMGSFAIESDGGQNHRPSRADISGRLLSSFGWSLEPVRPKPSHP